MRKLIIAAASLAALGACSQQPADEVSTEAEALVSGLALENMDKTIRPGDNFFMYMNGAWLDQTEIPADKASYGGFAILADEAQDNLKIIIEEAATGDFEKGTDEQKVGDLYNSYLDMDTRNARGVEPLAAHFSRIDKIANPEDLARYMAGANTRGVSMPIDIDQLADWNDSSKYSMVVTQGGLGLPDREYYLKDDEQTQSIRDAYVAHVEKMFDLAGLPDGASATQTILALETRLAEQNMPKEQVRNRAQNYQTFASDQWTDVMPQFPWSAWLDEVGVPEVDNLVLYMTDYLGALDGILRDTDLDTWKTYLHWNELNSAA
ncbi:MAG: M13 family metallopeptidase, partial [Gammaproteobacteria bacterium]|nr:M13 family metallopeptidase [Gammaproteobacteria bacterium]